jgi:hypothetical protein
MTGVQRQKGHGVQMEVAVNLELIIRMARDFADQWAGFAERIWQRSHFSG